MRYMFSVCVSRGMWWDGVLENNAKKECDKRKGRGT